MAREDIRMGEVIAVEEEGPLTGCSIFTQDAGMGQRQHCHNCFRSGKTFDFAEYHCFV